MIGNIVYGLKENFRNLVFVAAAAAALKPSIAAKVVEITARVGYGMLREQVMTTTKAAKDIYSVLTRKPGVKRPPIMPASDKAALRALASRGIGAARGTGARVAVRGITIVASPAVAIGAAGIGTGLLVSHGIGQLPDVQKAPPERGQPGMMMGVF